MPDPSIPAGHGFHVPFIKSRIPDWTQHLATAHLQALTQARDPVRRFIKAYPDLYAQASPALRQALLDSQAQSQTTTGTLARTLKDFKGITEFAKPLLVEALQKKFGQAPDVINTALFHLRAPNLADEQPLLQAALRNFEEGEAFDEVALQETSALAPTGALDSQLYDETKRYPFGKTRYSIRDKLSIKPAAFASLCRELDLGKRYQDHISAVFDGPGSAATVGQQTIAANKDRMRLQAHIARIRSHIDETAYTTVLALLDGSSAARLDGQPLAFSQVQILGSELGDVLIMGAASRSFRAVSQSPWLVLLPGPAELAKFIPDTRIIVYIPGDPQSPLKQYASAHEFAKDLAVKLRSRSYQRFFASFVPHDESATFFHRLKAQLKVKRWNPNPVYPGPPFNPDAYRDGVYEEVWNEDINLGLHETFIEGDVFDARYASHVARVKSNARLLAIPTAEVDHKAWIERLKHYVEWGLNVLNVAAFFVPGLGEVMLAVTAGQLTYEVYEGVKAWEEGDAEEAWAHFKSCLENVAFMAVLGAAASKAPSIVPSRFVNGMTKITTPFGEPRLWSPHLGPYKSSVTLDGLTPNALGQYKLAGKTYIQQEGNVYEKTFDSTLEKWRINHPSAPAAYQPILEHNGLGAWRHTLERPLEWDRPTLLRRMGPQMDGLSQARLEQIAEASGVSDDELRQMHVDHQPPPPMLVETLRAFKVDQQVDELIDQIRNGAPLSAASELTVPLALEMPNWPAEEVVEVFEGPEHWGASQRFGSASAVGRARSTIKITRAEVIAGKLPDRVLAALDESQIARLLGSRSMKEGTDRIQLFRERLADQGRDARKSLFDRLLNKQEATDPDIHTLQRSFPTLSSEAARQVLGEASAAELAQLRSTARVPLRQAKEIRVHLRQGSLNRAIGGLHLQDMASVASDKLALHSLEHLPGGSADVRVEVRSGSITGPLLDSIGNEGASTLTYLVKVDDRFRAFDAGGSALNNLPRRGRNLFESLLQVLPDRTRAGLEGDPGEALQKQLAKYASTHRQEMSLILQQRPINGPGPSLRLPSGGFGYLASGRGAGFPEGQLVSRVRDLYPNVSDEQASQFVRSRLSAGDTDQQVFNLLNNRQREFEALDTVLNNWIGAAPTPTPSGGLSRRVFSDRLIQCWRNGLYRDLEPVFDLDLRGADALPEWDADFSHVRNLQLNSGQIIGESGSAVLQQFPKLKKLEISVNAQDMAAMGERLSDLTGITELTLNNAFLTGTSELSRALEGMTQLEKLSLNSNMATMDYSALTNLRTLKLTGYLTDWPTGVLQLARLETLDLQAANIKSLPAELFNGHEPLWRSLQLNWAALEPEAFMKAYKHVHDNPAHLVYEPHMVGRYCSGRLAELLPEDYTFASDAMIQFNKDGLSGQALLDQVDALHEQRRALNQSLAVWKERVVRVDGQQVAVHHRELIAEKIRASWRHGLRARYTPQEPIAGPSWLYSHLQNDMLDLTGWGPLGNLPELGGTTFPHVRRLSLRGNGLSTAQVNDFLSAFPQLHTLELSSNRLTELPRAIEAMGQLGELDLSFNELTITASTQARLNRLTSLRTLNLAYNRVGALEVGSMTRLTSLDLSHTHLRAWPEGVLSLPDLRYLALNHSGITDIPAAAQIGHDQLLLKTSLQGCRLSPKAFLAVKAFAERTVIERPMGITRSLLSAGQTGGDPEFFPVEVSAQPDLVLPQYLEPGEGEVPLTSAARLQRLDPRLGTTEAVERIEAWRTQGMSATDIEARLGQWQQEQKQLIQGLNDWIDVPAFRNRGTWVSAVDRRRAADRLLECWRATLHDAPEAAGTPSDFVLDFTGLVVGDFPELPVKFNHVGALDLNGVRLSEDSDAFLRSFPRLHSLILNRNNLGALPEAVAQCEHLTHLSVSYNGLSASGPLHLQLRSLTHLQWLDLSENRLVEFDVTGLGQLQALDLSKNHLDDWPLGVLEAPALTTLNLRGNEIETIPPDAFQPEHAVLMAGTDLSDNTLDEVQLMRLQDYLSNTGRGLGFTAEQIDGLLEGFARSESSDTDDGDIHPDHETSDVQKTRWFAGVAAGSEKHQMWDAVMEQDSTHDFAYVLSQLQHTEDFSLDRLDLTRRVWRILEAAYGDEALSKRLMGLSKALRHRVTCGDGRILLFNELEVEVYEFEALKSIVPEHKGRELLKLSRGLFRLAQVEEVARTQILLKPFIDPAEIRLAYRIGLAQRLDLPAQPKGMLYSSLAKVTAADLDKAYTTILEQEKKPTFIEQLIARQYWRNYLEETYPAEFAKVQQDFQEKHNLLEDKYPEFDGKYLQEVKALDADNDSNRQRLLTELSKREMSGQDAPT